MAKESEDAMCLYQEVMETLTQVMNTEPPKEESALANMNITESSQAKKGLPNLLLLSKRKTSLAMVDATRDKRQRAESSQSTKPPSPWDIKKLKIDLIAAKAEITMLETRVNHQVCLKKEMEIHFEEEKVTFTNQHKRDERAVRDMEDRLNVVKRRHQEALEDLAQAKMEHVNFKTKWDADKSGLQKQIADLKDQLLEHDVSNMNEIAEMRKDMDEMVQGLEAVQSEVDILKKELARQTSRAEQCTALKIQLEKQGLELQLAKNKLGELQYEKDMYKDWQQHSKTALNRLLNMAELEKEVGRLRANERFLRENANNKLVMEEEMHQLQVQLEALKPAHEELCKAKVKLNSVESSLSEWEIAGSAHGLESPRALAAALEAALTNQLTALAAQAQAESKLAQVTEESATLKYERDKASASLNDLHTTRKTHESLITRLQKRLSIVTRERENYRGHLECCEKEIALSVSGDPHRAGPVALLTARVEQLETSLKGYHELQELCDQASHTAMVDGLRVDVTRWRDQAEQQRRDTAKLRTQRDHLQTQLERLITQDPWTKNVQGAAENPTELALKQARGDLEAANEEIKILKVALHDGGTRVCPNEFQQLKEQLESCQIKMQSMKDELLSSAQEYRDVCCMLLGYKLERIANKTYRIASVYAESPDEFLLFNICEGGVEMVHTEYSATLEELVEMHLQQQRSIPLFHSALTMQLFFRTTPMQQDMAE